MRNSFRCSSSVWKGGREDLFENWKRTLDLGPFRWVKVKRRWNDSNERYRTGTLFSGVAQSHENDLKVGFQVVPNVLLEFEIYSLIIRLTLQLIASLLPCQKSSCISELWRTNALPYCRATRKLSINHLTERTYLYSVFFVLFFWVFSILASCITILTPK